MLRVEAFGESGEGIGGERAPDLLLSFLNPLKREAPRLLLLAGEDPSSSNPYSSKKDGFVDEDEEGKGR